MEGREGDGGGGERRGGGVITAVGGIMAGLGAVDAEVPSLVGWAMRWLWWDRLAAWAAVVVGW